MSLDPTLGREVERTRPCVIVSPDEVNSHSSAFLVAPMTRDGHGYPFRPRCRFAKKNGFIMLDQLRTVHGVRLMKRVGRIAPATLSKALGVLREMFTE